MLLRTFFKDSLFYTVSTLLTRGLSFLLLPFYTRVLSTAELGVLDYLTVLGSFLAVTITLDIGQGLARYVPEARKDPCQLSKLGSTALWFTVSNYSVLVVLVALFKERISNLLLGSPAHADALLVAASLYWVNALLYIFQAQLRWELRAFQSSVVGAVNGIVTVLFSALFLLVLKMGVRGALFGQLVGGVTGAIVGFVFAKERYRFTFDVVSWRDMLSFSIPLVPSSIGVMVAMYVDRMAIKSLMTLADVGLYGVGNRIALIVSIGMVGFQGALTPLIYARYKDASTPLELARLFRIFAAVSLVLLAGLTLFREQILALIAPVDYMSASTVVPYLALGAIFSNLYMFAPGLEIEKRTGVVALMNVGVAVVNIVLNFSLIPPLGIVGAALATMVSAMLGFGFRLVLSQRLYPVPHSWPRLLAATIVTIVLVASSNMIEADGWSLVWLRGGTLFLISGMVVKLLVAAKPGREAQP